MQTNRLFSEPTVGDEVSVTRVVTPDDLHAFARVLAMDNAVSVEAAQTKGLTALVAGSADILVVPNLEPGNILAKELTYAAQAEGAGLVLGAKVPVLLTSRADNERARLFTCAVGALYAHRQATGESAVKPA